MLYSSKETTKMSETYRRNFFDDGHELRDWFVLAFHYVDHLVTEGSD